MFVRQQFQTKNGQRHAYWALVESYRTASETQQRVVAWLGKLDEASRLGVKRAAEELDETSGGSSLGTDEPAGRRNTSSCTGVPVRGHSISNCSLDSTMSLQRNRVGAKSMVREFAFRICDSLVDHGWPCYLPPANVADLSGEDLWKAYIQLTEAEAAFRIHKRDLSLRPIWYQKEERVLAHIFVCFVA